MTSLLAPRFAPPRARPRQASLDHAARQAVQTHCADSDADSGQRFAIRETTAARPVVWTDGSGQVLVHVDTLRVTHDRGWLRCDVVVEPEPARKRRVAFAFLAASTPAGGMVRASATVTGPRRSKAGLVKRCAADLEALLWQAVADGGLRRATEAG